MKPTQHPFRHERPAEAEPLFEERGSELHLAEYLAVLRRRWALIAVFLVICVAGGVVRHFMTPKMYQASSRIQIDRRAFNFGSSADAPWLETWWNAEFYPTQYQLLQSRGLAERVVSDLRLYDDPAFNPGWAAWAGGEAEGGSRELDEAMLGRLGASVQRGLSVNPVRGTQLVDITFRSTSPELAARIVNGVADTYIEWGLESRSESVGRATNLLDQQIDALKEDVLDKKVQLQGFQRADLAIMDTKSSPTLQRLEVLNSDYLNAFSARIAAEARYNELVSTPAARIAETLNDGMTSGLRRELMGLEREYATLLNVYKPEMPVMVELRGKIAELKGHLSKATAEAVDQARRTAQAGVSAARHREQTLAQELERAKDDTVEMGSATVHYNSLLMEVSSREGLLSELLQRRSEAEVSSRLQATRQSNVRVVDRALVPRSPSSPGLRRELGLAAAMGLMLGLGCVVLLEYMDRTVKSAEEAEQLLGLPVLAVIPDISDRKRYGYGYGGQYGYGTYGARIRRHLGTLPWRDKRAEKEESSIELLPQQKPRHAISEAYRSLRTALLLSSAEQLRIVSVTSAQSGEGKTATVANLGVVLAQLGRRVLLIDADLRKPRLHKVFGINNRTGLVNALTGGGEIADVIQKTRVPRLALAPSGPVPPNPSELLASERMRELLEQALRLFDVVLIDTPPVLAVTDSCLVGARADGTIYCLQAGRMLREEAKAARQQLHMSGVRVLGTVLNRYTPIKGVDHKHYYYHYEASIEDEEDRKSGGSVA